MASENLIVHYDKCLNMFGDCVEKQRNNVETYPCVFLVSTYIRLKNNQTYFLTYPHRFLNPVGNADILLSAIFQGVKKMAGF
jgi:hypothetical protein